MSKLLTAENLLSTFPMAADDDMVCRASVVAKELVRLYEDNMLLDIYARIDSLDETLIDILAYDFKIDWYDKTFNIEEKREIFKNCWKVRRKLGLPATINISLAALYQNAIVKEWWEYGGAPFYYKLYVNLGDVLTDTDKLQRAVDGAKYYKNVRSILEGVEVDVSKNAKIYVGVALQEAVKTTIELPEFDFDSMTWLVDERGNVLTDENEVILLS